MALILRMLEILHAEHGKCAQSDKQRFLYSVRNIWQRKRKREKNVVSGGEFLVKRNGYDRQ